MVANENFILLTSFGDSVREGFTMHKEIMVVDTDNIELTYSQCRGPAGLFLDAGFVTF